MGRTDCGAAALLGVLGFHDPLYGAGVLGLVFGIEEEEDKAFQSVFELPTIWY